MTKCLNGFSPILCFGAWLLLGLPIPLHATTLPPHTSIAMLSGEGRNLQLVEQATSTSMTVAAPTQWFCGTLAGLATGIPITIRVQALPGQDSPSDVTASAAAWPVMTYADTTRSEAYEWFVKDSAGYWVSGDPFKQGHAAIAGKGKVPEQTVIPQELAEQFLSADGQSWFPWRAVDHVDRSDHGSSIIITQRFFRRIATIATRVPYTYGFQQQLCRKIRAAQIPGVSIDDIATGMTREKVQVIRLDPLAQPCKIRCVRRRHTPDDYLVPEFTVTSLTNHSQPSTAPLILAVAGEHGPEAAGSWTLIGTLYRLLRDRLSGHATSDGARWLLIPLFDPSLSNKGVYDLGTNCFEFYPKATLNDLLANHDPQTAQRGATTSPTVIACAAYLQAFADAGHPVNLAISLRSSRETKAHVTSAFLLKGDEAKSTAFMQSFFLRLQLEQNLVTGFNAVSKNDIPRGVELPEWAYRRYGSLGLIFFVNDRYAEAPLSLMQLDRLGASMYLTTAAYLQSTAGTERATRVRQQTAQRREREQKMIQDTHWPVDQLPISLLFGG